MIFLGCHLSSAGGFAAMGETARSIGANKFQFFTRNPRGGAAKAVDPADAAALRAMLSVWGLLAFVKAADTRQNASFAIKLPSRKEARSE